MWGYPGTILRATTGRELLKVQSYHRYRVNTSLEPTQVQSHHRYRVTTRLEPTQVRTEPPQVQIRVE